jgi:hypothetical protein
MSDLKITGTTPLPPVLHHGMTCPTCKKPRELKVDKFASLKGATKGVRIRAIMGKQVNRGRPRKKRQGEKSDPRQVHFY